MRIRLLHLLYDIEVMPRKTISHAFSMAYTLIDHVFLTNQGAHRILSLLQIYLTNIPRARMDYESIAHKAEDRMSH